MIIFLTAPLRVSPNVSTSCYNMELSAFICMSAQWIGPNCLELFYFKVTLDGFSPVLLPSLKTLNLHHTGFPKIRDLMLLLNGCPILEDILTFDVWFDSEESLTCDEWKSFCLSNLTKADINCSDIYVPLKAVYNVASLRFEINQVCLLHLLMVEWK